MKTSMKIIKKEETDFEYQILEFEFQLLDSDNKLLKSDIEYHVFQKGNHVNPLSFAERRYLRWKNKFSYNLSQVK